MNFIHTFLFTVFISFLLSSSLCFAEKIVYVIDGDTVILDSHERVRLIGIDTPEIKSKYHRGEYYGKEAKKFLKEMIEGREVVLKPGREPKDKYGRRLAYLYLPDDTFVNEELVRQGYAETFRRFPFQFRDQFLMLEEEAKEAKLGMWGKRKRPWWLKGFWRRK